MMSVPASLARTIRMAMLDDEYLLWTISEGGAAVGSEMPAFEETLTEDAMWKIVSATRAGFPAPTDPDVSAAPAGLPRGPVPRGLPADQSAVGQTGRCG